MNNSKKLTLISIVFLTILAIVTYMLWFNKFGYYADDWYMIYSGIKFGAVRFFDVFASDRPFRGQLQYILYTIFSTNITAYYVLSVIIHLLAAISLWWVLLLIWKDKWVQITLSAAVFLIYPGFLEHPNAFDYQAHLFALLFMLLSIGFSIKVFTSNPLQKAVFFILSLGSALLSFMLIEYFIGMEAYRFLFLFFFLWNRKQDKGFSKIKRLIFSTALFSLPAIFFVRWRVFSFESTRYATDVDRLFSSYGDSMVLSIFNIVKRWFIDIGDVTFGAFSVPASQLIPRLGGNDFLLSVIMSGIAVIVLVFFLKLAKKWLNNGNVAQEFNKKEVRLELLFPLIALVAAFLCLLPINLAEREVTFLTFNRYSLPSSVGVAIFFVGLIFAFPSKYLRLGLVSLVIFSSVLTQNANSIRYLDEWSAAQDFWQDFILRVPDLANGTTLTGFHAGAIQEGYYIWGPANLIYHSDQNKLTITAEVLNSEVEKNIELDLPYKKEHRSFKFELDYSKALVFSKPNENSCLRMLDSKQIEVSVYDDDLIRLAAPYSQVDMILPDQKINFANYNTVFRPKAHPQNWCDLYEQASLARQFSDWESIISLAYQSESAELYPRDPLEWMPFIQAYAYLGYFEKADPLLDLMKQTPFYQSQACQIFATKPVSSDKNIQAGNEYLAKAFCE